VAGLLAITGATGELGGRVARRLAERGVRQRLVVRDPSRAPELSSAEVRAVVGGYADGIGMRAALDGVGTLLLVPAGEALDRADQHRRAVDAAVAAGVERIVYFSFVGTTPDGTFTFGRDHWATEEHARAAGVPFTFLRMSLYLDYLPFFVGPDGVIRGPAGEGHVAPVSRDDLADVAVAVLVEDGHEGRTEDVTGRERHTLAEAAAEMARLSGRPITFQDETLEEARASRASSGAADWVIEGWVTSYAAIAAGELDVVSDTVRRLAGHKPIILAEYLRDHPWALDHVSGDPPR
jgi:uncharacterized protein YbjT (DUF2867 family)